MRDYTLSVHFASETNPRHVERINIAGKVLSRMPVLLQGHRGCEHIVVMLRNTRMFGFECAGNTLPLTR